MAPRIRRAWKWAPLPLKMSPGVRAKLGSLKLRIARVGGYPTEPLEDRAGKAGPSTVDRAAYRRTRWKRRSRQMMAGALAAIMLGLVILTILTWLGLA